ncbi:MAG: alkaline phosphatase family protein [Candidatus Pacebacteria bacterium]|nr:alkaline phosphatase family protein [Candidatus Paceibacterota bacterium]
MYKWTKAFVRHPGTDLMVTAYTAYRLTKLLNHTNTSFYGIKYITGSCFRYWPEFDMVEKKLWSEPGFSDKYPTVFDILRSRGIPFKVSGFRRFGGGSSLAQLQADSFRPTQPWTFVFVGDVDGMMHKHGPESQETRTLLRRVDQRLETIYQELSRDGEDPIFMLFSDHGMTRVEKSIDIRKRFREHGLRLPSFVHMIDNNFARFWFDKDGDREKVQKVLASLEGGFVITDEVARQYHVDMPDNRFGDLIFYLDLPYAFGRTWYPLGLSAKTKPYHHGYSPDHSCMDGLLVASKSLRSTNMPIELCDIMPSILEALGQQVPHGLDGSSIWRTS